MSSPARTCRGCRHSADVGWSPVVHCDHPDVSDGEPYNSTGDAIAAWWEVARRSFDADGYPVHDRQSCPGRESEGSRPSPGVERILCAAIYVDTGEAEPPRRSYSYPETGLVFCGWRHPDCFTTLNAWAARLTAEDRSVIGEEQLAGLHQGFLTSLGRYVDRQEAKRIARAAGQLDGRHLHQGEDGDLWSEDLY